MTDTPDIAWPLIRHVAEGWPISEKEAAAIVDALRVPAPAVPDDVAETAKRLREATFTKGRMRGGVGGQTIEASMRSTFHEVSAWDLDQAADTIEAQAAELARIKAAADKLVNNPGWGTVNYTDGDMWADADALRAALTHPTGGSND